MATRWRTEPVQGEASQVRPKRPHAEITAVSTDSITSRDRANSGPSRLPRPQIYVHFEFGVTMSPTRPLNRRSFTYTSKQYNQDAQNLARSVPAPSTNFLVPSSVPAYHPWRQHSEPMQAQQNTHTQQPSRPAPSAFAVQRPHSPDYFQFQSVPPLQASARPSRNGSRGSSSHERGSSAPPPWNHNPWEQEPEPLGSSALPVRPRADVWKTLPPLPTSYRLSEQFADGPAWSPFSWPEEYGFPDAAEEDRRSREAPSHPSAIRITQPDEDPEPRRELERLGSAMATVDNGFEGQWWYQGERELMAHQLETGELVSVPEEYARLFCQGPYTTTSLPSSPMDSRTSEWSISRQPIQNIQRVSQNLASIISPSDDMHTPHRANTFDTSTVSPITASDATSPRPSGMDRVHTMPLRSDELFMSV